LGRTDIEHYLVFQGKLFRNLSGMDGKIQLHESMMPLILMRYKLDFKDDCKNKYPISI
jgi:hypothetical protein